MPVPRTSEDAFCDPRDAGSGLVEARHEPPTSHNQPTALRKFGLFKERCEPRVVRVFELVRVGIGKLKLVSKYIDHAIVVLTVHLC
jgi:hypothetical protein